MAELKAGGLAIVISSPVVKNVGRVVTLMRFWGELESPYTHEKAPAWVVRADSPMLLPDGRESELEGLIYSHKLMPIDGEDFQHEQDEQKSLITQ